MEKIIIFGAGAEGQKIAATLGSERIAFAVDNDPSKWNTEIYGVPVLPPDSIRERTEKVYVCVADKFRQGMITQQLIDMGIKNINYFCTGKTEYRENPKIKALGGKFNGRRCYIVGTGPSLRISDLEALKKRGEITFASNRIFKLYDKTDWRPDMYCAYDSKMFHHYQDTIGSLDTEYVFLRDFTKTAYRDQINISNLEGENKYIYDLLISSSYNADLNKRQYYFSDKPYLYISEGYTVTYNMIQLAAFLGFTEIYLIGVDFNYNDTSGKDSGRSDHCCENYVDPNEDINAPLMEDIYVAYVSAEEYSRTHGFRIYNATRGGKLEVFQRVNLDDFVS